VYFRALPISNEEGFGMSERRIEMRLDKYLKVSRLIKRRTLAKDVCDQGRISINGQTAKASSTVRPGDILTLRFGQRELSVKVLELKENPRKEEAESMYEIISEKGLSTPNEEDSPLW
jgi:ribosomal 50S subunit-recycling heat shock protein